MTRKPWAPQVAALAVLLFACPALADGPGPFVPTYAYVLEGSAIDVPLRSGFEPGTLAGLGMAVQERLALAWHERRGDELRLVFRVSGDSPAQVRSFSVLRADGSELSAPVGALTVVPAPRWSGVGVAVTTVSHDGEGALMWSVRLEHRGDRPQRLLDLGFAPLAVARGPVVIRHHRAGTTAQDLFEWVEELRSQLARDLPNARHLGAAETEGALRRLLPTAELRDPSALELEMAPGDIVDLLITRANFGVDLRASRLVSEPLLRGEDAVTGRWTLSLGGPWEAGVDR